MIIYSPDSSEKLDTIINKNIASNVKITSVGNVQNFTSQDLTDFRFGDIEKKHYIIRNAGNNISKGDICFRNGVDAYSGWGSGEEVDTLTSITSSRLTKNYKDINTKVIDTGYIDIDGDDRQLISVFSNTDNGININTLSSLYNSYIGNNEIVYTNASDSGKLYKKSVNDTSNGVSINSTSSYYPTYIGNNEVLYRNLLDSGKLYRKSVNDTSNGVAINTADSRYPTYIGNNEIVYSNASDGGKIYKKSLNDILNGIAINTVSSSLIIYIGNNEIVYRNSVDGGKLYRKSLNDTSNGIAINTVNSSVPTYIGNNEIIYINVVDDGKLYRKSVNNSLDGVFINAAPSNAPSHIGNNEIIYTNNAGGGKLYKKQISDSTIKSIFNDTDIYYQKQSLYNQFKLYKYDTVTNTETEILTITGTLFARCINIHFIADQLYLVYSQDTNFVIAKVIGSTLETVYDDEYSIESSYQIANYIYFISGSRQVVRYDALNGDLLYSTQKIDRNKIQFSNDGIYVFDIYGDKYDKFDYELNYDDEYTLSGNWKLAGENEKLIVIDNDLSTVKYGEVISDTINEIGSVSYSNYNAEIISYDIDKNRYTLTITKDGDSSEIVYEQYPDTTELIGVALNDAQKDNDVAIQTEDLDCEHNLLVTGQEYYVLQNGELTTTETDILYGNALSIDRIKPASQSIIAVDNVTIQGQGNSDSPLEMTGYYDGDFEATGGLIFYDELISTYERMNLSVDKNTGNDQIIALLENSFGTTNTGRVIIYNSYGEAVNQTQHSFADSSRDSYMCRRGGNLAIGKTTADEKLDIAGNVKATTVFANASIKANADDPDLYTQLDGAAIYLHRTAGSSYINTTAIGRDLIFRVSKVSKTDTNSIIIKGTNGYVGILNANPTVTLHVTGTFAASGIYSSTTASSSNVYVSSAGMLYRSTSSEMYKRDIEPANDSLSDIIEQVEVVWYRSKCEEDNKDWSYWGIIAEKLALIDPRFVFYGYIEEDYEEIEKVIEVDDIEIIEKEVIDKKTKEKTIEKIKKPIKRKETHKERVLKSEAQQRPIGVQYERLTTALIKKAQLQDKKINELEIRIDKLEKLLNKDI